MFKKTIAYGNSINSYDIIKLIALFTMIIDHLGTYFWQDADWLRAIGRMAFPLFLFLVGYSCNWKIKNDFIISAILIICFSVITHHRVLPFNILVTIALVRYTMSHIARVEITSKYMCGIFIMGTVWFPLFLWCEYSTIAVLFAMSGYISRQKPGAYETHMFLYATIVLHSFIQYYSFNFSIISIIITLLGCILIIFIIRNFRLYATHSDNLPDWLCIILQWSARNTLPIYVFHVIGFMIIEYIFFPGRLIKFHWV